MILNQFQVWARTAPASGRADGISALARAYLFSPLDARQRADAVRVMTAFLDDPSADVRRALAQALAGAAEAPAHLVLALAEDCASVAAIVLARSPVLTDADLIDCAAAGESSAQSAIATRPDLSPSVAAALAEIAAPQALVALARNTTATLPAFALRRMIERHGDLGDLREALLARDDLTASMRLSLVAATARALGHLVRSREWLSDARAARVTGDAGARAALMIAADDGDARRDVVAHLRQSGQLTPTFAFRAILSGKIELFKTVLVELSGMPFPRVDALTRRHDGTGFATLYHRCGLPRELLPAFRLALDAAREADWTKGQHGCLSLAAITRVLTGCEAIGGGTLDKLLVLLRRFEGEASRDDARRSAAQAALSESRNVAPLVLTEIDALERPPHHRRSAKNPFFAIDMAAIEAELLVA